MRAVYIPAVIANAFYAPANIAPGRSRGLDRRRCTCTSTRTPACVCIPVSRDVQPATALMVRASGPRESGRELPCLSSPLSQAENSEFRNDRRDWILEKDPRIGIPSFLLLLLFHHQLDIRGPNWDLRICLGQRTELMIRSD